MYIKGLRRRKAADCAKNVYQKGKFQEFGICLIYGFASPEQGIVRVI